MSLVSYDSGKGTALDAARIGEPRAYLFSDIVDSEKAPSEDAIAVERASMTSRPDMSVRSSRTGGMSNTLAQLS